MAEAVQAYRLIRVNSPLGADALLFRRMAATEALSQPFAIDLDLLSENPDIKGDQLLGQPMTIAVDPAVDGAEVRPFHGLVDRFAYRGTVDRYASYAVTLRPWLWFLGRNADCRIFQNKTAPDILKQVFHDRGFSEFEDKLTSTYRTWDYCVQYRETDLNFVSRLMEQEGIFYFFRHESKRHVLVLADADTPLSPAAGYAEIPYYPPESSDRRERDNISDWQRLERVETGVYALRDFDFTKPRVTLEGSDAQPLGSHSLAKFEYYDYPGEYLTAAEATSTSRMRLEELQADARQVTGGGDAAGLAAGNLFRLTGHPRKDQNAEYLILATTLELASDAYVSGSDGSGTLCRCSFTAVPGTVRFRPRRLTPKPMVQGLQTGFVTGPPGEEIHTDKYGRVKVQFHWDRRAKGDDTSSCWIRVGQAWASNRFGSQFIPRVGDEVIVAFLEGDPDRPLIIGSVYNDKTMPPMTLPDQATMSGLKSNSSKGGGGYNEIRMEDKKGSEEIFIHAARDYKVVIEGSHSPSYSKTIKVGDSEKTLDSGNEKLDVKAGNITIKAPAGTPAHGKRGEVVGTTSIVTHLRWQHRDDAGRKPRSPRRRSRWSGVR
ncbi:MAG: type VI secretion system tip protein VgrG [Rhodospirillales bacterium]|nr:type VI secretion system tip protein VgrG [Rhodospirillales bacterium]